MAFWYFIIGIIILYVTYRLCATMFFPKFGERRSKRYRDRFMNQNKHIDQDKLPQHYFNNGRKTEDKK